MIPPDDRSESIRWARECLADPSSVILDSETTGLDRSAEMVEIAILDVQTGRVLLDALICPDGPISKGAYDVHGISQEHVATCCTMDSLWKPICHYMHTRRLLIYNADFDTRIIKQSCLSRGLEPITAYKVECVMLRYSAFVGEWNSRYGEYRWQKLPAADGQVAHSAVGDCRSTLALLRRMAESPLPGEAQCSLCGCPLPGFSADQFTNPLCALCVRIPQHGILLP